VGRERRADVRVQPLCCFSAAVLRGLSAPAFAFTVFSGADWNPSVVVSRVDGRWRELPFEAPVGYSDSSRPPDVKVIDFKQLRDGLVETEMDGSGAASGPETYTWYRFNGRLFVATAPPGPRPPCSNSALDSAPHIYSDYTGSYSIARFACADGWALARGTLHGRPVFGLYEQREGAWVRVAVGRHLTTGFAYVDRWAMSISFAIPQTLLRRLAARL
jgi:hypothetical protein